MNIPIRGRFETWTGIMLPWGRPFVLVGSDAQVKEAAFRLHRIGYDEPAGYLEKSAAAWQADGKPTRQVTLVEPAALKEQMDAGKAPILVDVRLPKEWMALRIAEKLLNMPINELAVMSTKLNPAMPVLTICNSAYRSSMGASVLLKEGFSDVRNLNGGSQAWIDAGLPTFSAKATAAGAHTAAVHLDIPERMSPADLAQRLMDLPGTVEVVDIRPDWQFGEFHIPGSINASAADVMNSAAYLVGKNPLVIVCRDGSISAAVGGAIAPKTERSIRYLAGGATAYWQEIMMPAGVVTEKMIKSPPPAQPAPSTPGPAPTPSPAPTPAPKPKKRVSAGC